MSTQTFYYKAYIMRNGQRITREGSLQEKYPLDALDKLVVMASTIWKRPLLKIELYEIDKDGALAACATVGDRVNAVLATNAALNPTRYASILERRKIANVAVEPEKPIAKQVVKIPEVEDNEWNWMIRHGTRHTARSFVTLKKVLEI